MTLLLELKLRKQFSETVSDSIAKPHKFAENFCMMTGDSLIDEVFCIVLQKTYK